MNIKDCARRHGTQRRVVVMLAGVAIVLAGSIASALDGLVVQMQGAQGAGWRTGPVTIELNLSQANALSFVAHAGGLQLPSPFDDAQEARVECPRAQHVAGRLSCMDASVVVSFAAREPVRFDAAVSVDPANSALSLKAVKQSFVGGQISLDWRSQADSFEVDASFSELDLASLQQMAVLTGRVIPISTSAGQVSGRIRVRSGDTASLDVHVRGGAFSDEQGSRAGEDLLADLRISARADDDSWHFESTLSMNAGVVYLEPLLIEVGKAPVALRTTGQWWPVGRVRLSQMVFDDPQGLRLDGSIEFGYMPGFEIRQATIRIPQQSSAALYERYLKPFAGAGLASDLRFAGELSAHLDWSQAPGMTPTIVSGVRFEELDLGDTDGELTILGVTGELWWRSDSALDAAIGGAVKASNLRWNGAQVRALELGAGSISARLHGRDIELLAPVAVQLLDGEVTIERLLGRDLATPDQHMEVQLSLSPISLQQLSDRLAWLPLSGQVAGRIPMLILTADSLQIDGDMHMQLFDGRARISNVSVQHPFSPTSRLHADVMVEDIELGLLSQAFSFGRIDGRLNVQVRDLVLESWQPVSFDARLATPVDDPSRHRISQRAVDNLASLGGANAVLSSTFLRFFEEFSYARLGLSCRLQDGVCEMGGVAPAPQGYYIVEGGGMPPRVDVVGYNSRVDWATLLDRLKAVSGNTDVIIR